MACRDAYKTKTIISETPVAVSSVTEPVVAKTVSQLFFGVDSKIQSNDLLQNNIKAFELPTADSSLPWDAAIFF